MHLKSFIAYITFISLAVSASARGESGARPQEKSLREALTAAGLTGVWQDENDHSFVLGVAEGRLLVLRGGQISVVAKILRIEGTRLETCQYGRTTFREWSLSGEEASFRDPETADSHQLRRASASQKTPALEAMSLPQPKPLPRQRIEEIQIEISKRLGQDQQALLPRPADHKPEHEPGRPSFFAAPGPEAPSALDSLKRAEVTSNNTAFLKRLMAEVGWIDASRFGYLTANAAFILVQHSNDFPLMLAALPRIQKDADSGGLNKEAYALLFDRLQLMLGEKQRYGSQVSFDKVGQPFLFPVEDPTAVAALRESMGMVPLARMLKLFGASEVHFSSECETPLATARTIAPH